MSFLDGPPHPPTAPFEEIERGSLADALAHRVRGMIQDGQYAEGDRLPAIRELARRFGVGIPTMREALKKLETLREVDFRHGAGVYVASRRELLVLVRPQLGGAVRPQVLVDLIETRIHLEVAATQAVALRASSDELLGLRHLIEGTGVDADARRLAATDAAFHRQLAAISGNTILAQLLDALRDLFADEGRLQSIALSRDSAPVDHLGIVEALERRDAVAAGDLMRGHLERVRDAIVAVPAAQRSA